MGNASSTVPTPRDDAAKYEARYEADTTTPAAGTDANDNQGDEEKARGPQQRTSGLLDARAGDAVKSPQATHITVPAIKAVRGSRNSATSNESSARGYYALPLQAPPPAGRTCRDYAEGMEGTFYCPGGADCLSNYSVYGTGPYSGDSSPCLAARHAGALPSCRYVALTPAGLLMRNGAVREADRRRMDVCDRGGPAGYFTVKVEAGRPAYSGSTAGGVTSSACGPCRFSIAVGPATGPS